MAARNSRGGLSAFGTDYEAVAEWTESRLPPLEPTTADEALKLSAAAAPRLKPNPKLPTFLRRSQRSHLKHKPFSASKVSLAPGYNYLDRSAIESDPFSASGLNRASMQARRRRAFAEPLRPAPRRLYGEEAALTVKWNPPTVVAAPPERSRTSELVRRILIAKELSVRTSSVRGSERDAWTFQLGSFSLGAMSDPVLLELLDDRLRAGNDAGTTVDEAHAQLTKRMTPVTASRRAEHSAGSLRAAPAQTPPAWLTAAHLELEEVSQADDAEHLEAEPPTTEQAEALHEAYSQELDLEAPSAQSRFSAADLAWRARVRADPWMRSLLASCLAHFDADRDGVLNFTEYCAASKAIYAVLHNDYDHVQADRIAREDWVFDAGERGYVGLEAWASLWLQLADLWVTRVSLREYASFLIAVLLQLPFAVPSTLATQRTPSRQQSTDRATRASSRAQSRKAMPTQVASFPYVGWRQTFDEVFAQPSEVPSTDAAQRLGRQRRSLDLHVPRASTSILSTSSFGTGGDGNGLNIEPRMARSWTAIETFHHRQLPGPRR